ncbi:carboxymuconolactone decarboxylase family protein [Mycobacterium sp. Y57]|uniref:carboxymuconolactone decarboxylase family protein n=1 Tax=Mycolicibacterium xanthum TaxID=2796469 RepID=UPI001C84B726|nr:carboxymuconolactone decarboxylase family protein [Mycolicibacterium xanthum]MBX7433092.1 carboxymuconolactone decarboxylase family protein [Mycolicibacterium xanthum]
MSTEAEPAFRDVMDADPLTAQIWKRPGLSRRNRRFVTLTCVCATEPTEVINEHVYAALASGDISYPELLEFVLQFAVYCGWPRGSEAEVAVKTQYARLAAERGEDIAPLPDLPVESLGPTDHEQRLAEGERCFVDISLLPAPARDSPYFQAGILGFVFGHLWRRPGLGRRERRLITVAAAGLAGAIGPIYSHVGSALQSHDIGRTEMNEAILQFSAYHTFAKGRVLQKVADETWQRISPDDPEEG